MAKQEFERWSDAFFFIKDLIVKPINIKEKISGSSSRESSIVDVLLAGRDYYWPVTETGQPKAKKFVVFYQGGDLRAFLAVEPKPLEQSPHVKIFYPKDPTEIDGPSFWPATEKAEFNQYVGLALRWSRNLVRSAEEHRDAKERAALNQLARQITRDRTHG